MPQPLERLTCPKSQIETNQLVALRLKLLKSPDAEYLSLAEGALFEKATCPQYRKKYRTPFPAYPSLAEGSVRHGDAKHPGREQFFSKVTCPQYHENPKSPDAEYPSTTHELTNGGNISQS